MMADDFFVVPKPRKGIAFVEARLKPSCSHTKKGREQIIARLELELSRQTESNTGTTSITLNTDLLDDPILKQGVPSDMFQSLRVVELQGFDPSERNVPVHDVAIKINIYKFNDSASDPSPSPQCTSDFDMVTVLPSSHYDGLWELLVLEIAKPYLFRWVMNLANLHGNLTGGAASKPTDAVFLLTGPCGSGKTTLARALAQKLSIFFWTRYSKTFLHHATPSSTFDFHALARDARAQSNHMFILIVDDVDDAAMARNHSQLPESRGFINAYLRGLDSLSSITNVLVICTFTSGKTLDARFLDRCGIPAVLLSPSEAERYEILRRQFHAHMDAKIIDCDLTLTEYKIAVVTPLDCEIPLYQASLQVLGIAKLIPDGTSARVTTNTVTQALMTQLACAGACNMDQALDSVYTYCQIRFELCNTIYNESDAIDHDNEL